MTEDDVKKMQDAISDALSSLMEPVREFDVLQKRISGHFGRYMLGMGPLWKATEAAKNLLTLVESGKYDHMVALSLWAIEARSEMEFSSRMLDGIKSELYASVYSVTDDEFEKVYTVRDLLDLVLAKFPKGAT